MIFGTLIVPAAYLVWHALLLLALAGSLTSTIYLALVLIATAETSKWIFAGALIRWSIPAPDLLS